MPTPGQSEPSSSPMEQAEIRTAIEAHARWLVDPGQEGARRGVFDGRHFPGGADLRAVDLSAASFVGADLSGARLSDATLVGADFSNARLVDADMTRAELADAVLSQADLSRARLSDTSLLAVHAPGSRWVGADLSEANLYHARLVSADLTDARLKRARLIRADLSGARLTGADCYGADFRFASLRGVAAAKADFREARLTGSDRTDADFTDAALEPGLLGRLTRAVGGAGEWVTRQAAEYGPTLAELAAARVLGIRIGEHGAARSERSPGPLPAVPAGLRQTKEAFSAREFRERRLPVTGIDYLLAPPTADWGLNLVGIGIGEKVQGGRRTGHWATVFFVRHKLPAARVPDELRLPRDLGGLPTDVVEAGVFRLHGVGPGTGISADQLPGNPPRLPGWGTLGTLVRVRPARGPVHLLSAAHVLTDAARQPGPGTPIFAPPVGTSGFAAVATLRNTCLADQYRQATNDYVTVDAGVAELQQAVDDATLRTMGGLPSGTAAATVGTAVEKIGLNGHTDGTVAFIDTDVKNFLTPVPHAIYLNQVLIRPRNATTPFSHQGDSGALVMTREERAAVALLIGESFDGTERLTFAAPIEEVLTALDAELITR